MSIDKGEYLQFAEAAVEAVDALRGFQRGLRVFGHNLNSTATQDERTAFIAAMCAAARSTM